jgi:hypothetical protein
MVRNQTTSRAAFVALCGFACSSATAQCPPGQPQNVSASQGVWCGSVELDWTDVSGANRYDIYRNTVNNYQESGFVGFSLVSDFTDLTAGVGTSYYYWVVARRTLCLGNNSSAPSAVRQGWRAQDPAAPTGVGASDGTHCGGVLIGWSQPEILGGEVDSYTIYRNTVNLYLTSSSVGTASASRRWFFDGTADPSVTYYYWVRAENQCGVTASSGDDGYRSAVSGPVNDLCAGATVVTAGTTYVGSTSCAGSEGPEACSTGSFSPDVWYRFNAAASGTLHLSTCGSSQSFDTVLSVFLQNCAPSTTASMVGCNDDACPAFLSSLNVPVVSGNPYYIRVAGFQGASGNFSLEVGFTPQGGTPCYANCDASTTSPVLNVADFTCFLQRFAAGNSYANCDASTTSPVLNVADFTCFLQRFAAGCP